MRSPAVQWAMPEKAAEMERKRKWLMFAAFGFPVVPLV